MTASARVRVVGFRSGLVGLLALLVLLLGLSVPSGAVAQATAEIGGPTASPTVARLEPAEPAARPSATPHTDPPGLAGSPTTWSEGLCGCPLARPPEHSRACTSPALSSLGPRGPPR